MVGRFPSVEHPLHLVKVIVGARVGEALEKICVGVHRVYESNVCFLDFVSALRTAVELTFCGGIDDRLNGPVIGTRSGGSVAAWHY
jgi:hypothetical protein